MCKGPEVGMRMTHGGTQEGNVTRAFWARKRAVYSGVRDMDSLGPDHTGSVRPGEESRVHSQHDEKPQDNFRAGSGMM